MKKQFNRMRQLANQTVEKRLELVKQVSHSTHKKLTACLQGQQGVEVEKKSVRSPSKKLPLTTLAQCMVEGAAVLGDESLLGKMLKLCGETQDKLAQELIQFEVTIERDVIEPLYDLAEVEIPNIQKQRKHLAKLVLDMDSARTRFYQSSKSSGLSSTLQPAGAKAEHHREEMEEAANRMEICRDQLSADMYSFMAKEIEYARYFQTLIDVQSEYHKKSLELLQSLLPQIKAHQESWVEKPCYGKALEEHLDLSGRDIAFPIEACVTMLLECGLQEEGLFRVAPSASKLKKLKASLDCGVMDVQEYSADPHAIAGALKSYLRELPEPLMTFELYDEWIQSSNIQDQDKRKLALQLTCDKLPPANANNFKYLIKFLSKLTEYQDDNKMTPGNIAIVLGPNLLWTHSEGNITEMMTTVSLQIVGIIEPIIQHADSLYPGEIEFNVTGNYGSPVHTNHNANYSSMPSPDMELSERRHNDQSRRPLSVATDNMMLEFYKKDGIRKIQSMGVRVMDTSWVSRRGSSSAARNASPGAHPPTPPFDALAPEYLGGFAAGPPSPTPPPTSSSEDASSAWSEPCYAYPSPEEERPPPPYPYSSSFSSFSSSSPSASPCPPPPHPHHTPPPSSSSSSSAAGGGRPGGPSPPPPRWAAYTPPPLLPQQLDINSNPRQPSSLHLPRQTSLCTPGPARVTPPEAGGPPPYVKTPLVLTRHHHHHHHHPPPPPHAPPPSAPPPWAACACSRDRGAMLTSTLKNKELSPVIGQKGMQGPAGSVGQLSHAEHSPCTVRRARKLAPIPPKVPYCQSGAMSDQSTGQPSPVSLSPTPPSTPSPYSFSYPQGYATIATPGHFQSSVTSQSLPSPPSLGGTLTKARPTPKPPRSRPNLPPPQPPSTPGSSPQPLEPSPGLLDGLSPGESMSTGKPPGWSTTLQVRVEGQADTVIIKHTVRRVWMCLDVFGVALYGKKCCIQPGGLQNDSESYTTSEDYRVTYLLILFYTSVSLSTLF
uniref:Rho GTPase activating protein 44 n=1 Tax=Gadus morhua TaxID=8049 RepID=A0A8C5BFS9_GADMO